RAARASLVRIISSTVETALASIAAAVLADSSSASSSRRAAFSLASSRISPFMASALTISSINPPSLDPHAHGLANEVDEAFAARPRPALRRYLHDEGKASR